MEAAPSGKSDNRRSDEDSSHNLVLFLQLFGAAVTFVPILVASIRLIRVSSFDTAKLLTILRHVDFLQLFAATFLPVFPIILLTASVMAFIWVWNHGRAIRNAGIGGFSNGVLITLFFIAIALIPITRLIWMGFVAGGVLAIELIAVRRARRKGSPYTSFDPWTGLMAPVATVVLWPLLFSSSVWVSPEVISLNERPDIVGYVLGHEGSFTALLIEEGRTIELVRSDSILNRKTCVIEEYETKRPLAGWISGTDDDRSQECPVAE